jgi:hypothetical protein
MMPGTTRTPTAIFPEALYSRRGFITASGISETKLREARKWGIELRKIWCGKRCFIRGRDAIAFIESLAGEEITRECREAANV